MKNVKILFTLCVLTILGIVSCTTKNSQDAKNMDTIRKAYEALSNRDYKAFASYCADNYTELSLGPKPIEGIEASIAQYKVFFDAFPDFKVEATEIAPAGNNRYFSKLRVSGTNTGNFLMLPPTNAHFELTDMDIIEMNAQGKAISHWVANPAGSLIAVGYGSIVNPSTGVVIAAYDAFGKKDIPAILNLCNEDVVFEIHDDIIYPNGIQTFKGKEEVAKFFQDIAEKLTFEKFQPSRFLADGNDVVALVNAEFKVHKSSGSYKTGYCHHFKTMNNKISYFKGVLETPVKI